MCVSKFRFGVNMCLFILLLAGNVYGGSVIVSRANSPYAAQLYGDTFVNCDDSAGSVVINLPPAVGSGRRMTIEKVSAARHACTVNPKGSDRIDDLTGAHNDPIYYLLAFFHQTVVLTDRSVGAWARFSDFNDSEDSYTLGNGITHGQDVIIPADVITTFLDIGQWVPAPGLYDAHVSADIDIGLGDSIPTAIVFRFAFSPRWGGGPAVIYEVNPSLLAQATPNSTLRISISIGSNGNDGVTGEVLVSTLAAPNAHFTVQCTSLGAPIMLGASSHFINFMSYGGGAGGIVPPS